MGKNNIIHCHSEYSLFDSTQSPKELVHRVKEIGGKNVTLTDHGTLLGIEPFMEAGVEEGINTIPGVEAYGSEKTHHIICAMNYDGYVSISHAMRDANTNIEKIKKMSYPIMTDTMMERHFKNNPNIFATTACIQGPLGYILLENYRIKRKSAKHREALDKYREDYEKWNEINEQLKSVTGHIKTLKKEQTENKRYLRPGYLSKIEKLRKKLEDMDPSNENFLKIKNEMECAQNVSQMASELDASWRKEISEQEEHRKKLKKELEAITKAKEKYQKAKEAIDGLPFVEESILYQKAKERLLYMKSIFAHYFIELQYHGLEEEAYVMPILVRLARETNTPVIAANDAHITDNSESSLEARRIVRFNYFEISQEISKEDRELYIKTDDEVSDFLCQIIDPGTVQEAIQNTSILEECHVVFPKEHHYPTVKTKDTFDEIIIAARDERIKNGNWSEEYEERLKHEVSVIKNMGFVDYHMVVHDICAMGRMLGAVPKEEIKNIPEDFSTIPEWIAEKGFHLGVGIGPGRGSAVGSLVCNLLGITNVDPLKYNLIFERFLNPERITMPDIDTDVAKRLRPVIIRYLKWKYGERAVCSIATETTYGAKNAIQMAGRERAAQLYKNIPDKYQKDDLKRRYMYDITLPLSDAIPEEPGITLEKVKENVKNLIHENSEREIVWNRAILLEGKISGTGVHAGGIIISDNDNVNDYIPLAWNVNKQVWAAQCNMVTAEKKGLLKMDVLGLNTLDCISDCVRLIKKHHGVDIDVDKIPIESDVFKEIYEKGNTNSVFQFESQGMKSMLREFRPNCLEDLILLVACYRPGPMQYLDDIIKVKNGTQPVLYKTPELEDILASTYGAIVYQEQVMQIFQKLAGYSLGSADLVRRAMSKKNTEKLNNERDTFVAGCVNNGIAKEIADALFDEMTDFAKYAFNKSHAAVYAVVSYQTAWLKYHYPAEYLCSMFNNKKQDEYEPLIEDCNKYGVRILLPDINHAHYDFVVENGNIRYGFCGIKGIGDSYTTIIEQITDNRKESPYSSVYDFLKRNLRFTEKKISILPDGFLSTIIDAGSFDSFGYNRSILRSIGEISGETEDYVCGKIDSIEMDKTPKDRYYNMQKEIEYLGTIVSEHPLDEYYGDDKYQCVPMDELKDGKVSIFGFVSFVSSKKSKKGRNMYLLTLNGKRGTCTVYIIGKLYDRYTKENLEYRVLKITGDYNNHNVFAKDVDFLSPYIDEYYAELDSIEKTKTVTDILLHNETDRTTCITLNCHFLKKDGTLFMTDKPKVAKRMFSQSEISIMKEAGIEIKKWSSQKF